MSIEIMNAVWKHSKAIGRPRLVLLAIADHQGEIGAWPSIKTLSKMVNASERSVQRDITHLQAIGELRVEKQNAPTNGQYKANLYWVTVATGVTNATAGVTESASGVTAGGVLTLNRTLKEDIKRNEDKYFNEFWNEYPVKKDKARAFKAFRSALSRAKFEDIIAGAIAYRNDPERKPQFTKFPATWLNADAWENAATTPEERQAYEARRAKEIAATQQFLKEQEEAKASAVAPPKCEHGETQVKCKRCVNRQTTRATGPAQDAD